VVDDSPGNRYAVAHTLRLAGMEVVEGVTGHDALRLAAQEPDLIVLAVNLPDMSANDVVRTLKRSAATASIPVVHVSATYTRNVDKAAGLEAGADAFLTHPIDPVIFLATIRALLRAARAEARVRDVANEWVLTFDGIADAVFLLDEAGGVLRTNRAGAALAGLQPRDLVGQSLAAAIERRFGDASRDAITRVVEQAPVQGREVQVGDRWFLAAADDVLLGSHQRRITVALTDIHARKAAELEREQLVYEAAVARTVAERASRAKTVFLGAISHELRTPLNAIMGYAALLADGMRGPVTPEQKTDLTRVERAAGYITRVVNDLLDLARLESTDATIGSEVVDVEECVAAAAGLVAAQASAKRLTLTVAGSVESFTCTGDRDRILQVLLNLLSNAIKFTAGPGEITVSGERGQDKTSISVRDTGRGIASDQHEEIFRPFVQVGSRTPGAEKGVGLGLAISRELARKMGGDLTVQSALGVGSTFTLTLPLG
jgi:PAS domain S-box-containing protein